MSSLDITWEKLFPQEYQKSLITNGIQKKNPEQFWTYVHKDYDGTTNLGKTSIRKQKIIIRMFLPDRYRLMKSGIDFTDNMNANLFTRYFNYTVYTDPKTKQDSEIVGKGYYELVKTHILNEAGYGNYDFIALPFIKTVKENAKAIFQYMDKDEFKKYKEKTSELIKDVKKDTSHPLQKLIAPLSNLDFYDQISSLIAIASTWHCISTSTSDCMDLASFILPASQDENTVSSSEWVKEYISDRQKESESIFSEAQKLYEHSQYIQAAELFESITKFNFADESLLGKTYYLWAKCYLNQTNTFNASDSLPKKPKKSTNPRVISVKRLLKKACDYGNTDAIRLYKREYGDSEFAKLLRPISETHGKARIIINCGINKYVDEWMKSLPVEMRKKEIRDEMVTTATQKDAFISALKAYSDCRFLLFDDNFEKNFQDLLFVLDGILQTSEKNDSEFITSLHWYEKVIYIRVPEDKYSTLIDTALKRLGDYTIRVFIIDDNKRVAQNLLNKYPLFIPISHIPATDLCKKPVNINFNIISRNNDDLSRWLIREAYWLGCFYYTELSVSINLISPDAKHVEETLRFDFPGMFDTSNILDCKPAILNNNSFKQVTNLSYPEIMTTIDGLDAPNTYNYFVINAGDDIDNLNYGIKLREICIRKIIKSGKLPQKGIMPLIAFYCENSDIGYLTEHLVVQNVDSGDKWFNNYNLIPFGALQDRYAWENLDGGYLEKIAQSTHLQYSGAKTNDDMGTKIGYLKDYFSRCYNRDSSMAIALSMPYRLFQTSFGKNGHILPFENYNQLSFYSFKEMADSFNLAIVSEENKKNLLNYEHSRWVFWALSRGWQKADSSEVLTYMKAGNPKHQLYIARMHGCINSLQNLTLLSQAMLEYVQNPKNNIRNDEIDFSLEDDSKLLIRAMKLIGMDYDSKNSSFDSLLFIPSNDDESTSKTTLQFEDWDDVQQWLENADVNEDVANAIDDILYSPSNIRRSATANEKRYADVIQHYTSTTKLEKAVDAPYDTTDSQSRRGQIDRQCYDYYELVPKNFIEYDEKNISQTADIITAAWFPKDMFILESSAEEK